MRKIENRINLFGLRLKKLFKFPLRNDLSREINFIYKIVREIDVFMNPIEEKIKR